MRKITFIIFSLLTFNIFCLFPQKQQEILDYALKIYQKELPNLQETIFRKFCKLNKQSDINEKDIGTYQIIVVPTFKLNKNFAQYKVGDMLAGYIDFKKMWNSYDGYIFKDGFYVGLLHFDKKFSFFNPTIDNNLAKQIGDFQPDMVFYPDCGMLLCCIKDGKFYIAEMIKTSECIFLTEEEFTRKYPTRIEELSKFGFPALKRYKELK